MWRRISTDTLAGVLLAVVFVGGWLLATAISRLTGIDHDSAVRLILVVGTLAVGGLALVHFRRGDGSTRH